MNTKELEDRILLKELIDNISIAGDKKDFETQVQFFVENANLETFVDGVSMLKLEGRKAMIVAFEDFLKNFDTVNHFNGQQVVTIDGDTAVGTSYCLITLIGNVDGKKMKRRVGAIYKDKYERIDNKWFVAKRDGNFEWQEQTEIN